MPASGQRQAELSEQSRPESQASKVSGRMRKKFLKATGRLLRQSREHKGRGHGRGRCGRGMRRGGQGKVERTPATDLTAALGAKKAASGGTASGGKQARAPRGTMGTFAGYKRPVGEETGKEFDMIREAYHAWTEQRKEQTGSKDSHEVQQTAGDYLKYMRAKVKELKQNSSGPHDTKTLIASAVAAYKVDPAAAGLRALATQKAADKEARKESARQRKEAKAGKQAAAKAKALAGKAEQIEERTSGLQAAKDAKRNSVASKARAKEKSMTKLKPTTIDNREEKAQDFSAALPGEGVSTAETAANEEPNEDNTMFDGKLCPKVLVEDFGTLSPEDKAQLADRFQCSSEEAYYRIMKDLSGKDPDFDSCHSELVLNWGDIVNSM